MSDDAVMETTLETTAEPADPRDIDRFLAALVKMVNSFGKSIPITLSVNGLTVSGFLIGGYEYVEQLAEQWDRLAVREAEEHPHVSYSEWIKEMFRDIYPGPTHEPVEQRKQVQPSYIHLKDARIFAPGMLPMPSEGTLWRGRLKAVDGFSLGHFVAHEGETGGSP